MQEKRSSAELRFKLVYVVVCRGPNCRARGALPLRRRLTRLLHGDPAVRLLGYSCFGQCDHGPNVLFYSPEGPSGEWYGGLSEQNDADRVVAHARDGAPLCALQLTLPEPDRLEHLRNVEELVRTLEADRARPRRWWWPF